MLVQHLVDAIGNFVAGQQQRRDIDCYRAIGPLVAPACTGQKRLIQHGVRQCLDDAVLFGYSDEP